MADITPEALVNVELAAGAEVSVEAGGSAEIRVELTPAAEIAVELTPAAEVTVELSEGPAVDVELEGGPELLFMGEGALDGYYDKSETDALLERKAEAVHDHDGRYYTQAEADALLALKVARAALLDLVYPVGAIYMSVSDASPASIFGGTWERITGRFLLAATDGGSSGALQEAGRTGGEATHTLTLAEMPSHSHRVSSGWNATGGEPDRITYGTVAGTYQDFGYGGVQFIENSGGDGAHNNMPPYLAVYVWKRVS